MRIALTVAASALQALRLQKHFFSHVFGAGAKTHFQNPKVPLVGGRQMGDMLAVQ
jgi:hypothetical protein